MCSVDSAGSCFSTKSSLMDVITWLLYPEIYATVHVYRALFPPPSRWRLCSLFFLVLRFSDRSVDNLHYPGVLQLADDPAALHRRRVYRRGRHHDRVFPVGRAEEDIGRCWLQICNGRIKKQKYEEKNTRISVGVSVNPHYFVYLRVLLCADTYVPHCFLCPAVEVVVTVPLQARGILNNTKQWQTGHSRILYLESMNGFFNENRIHYIHGRLRSFRENGLLQSFYRFALASRFLLVGGLCVRTWRGRGQSETRRIDESVVSMFSVGALHCRKQKRWMTQTIYTCTAFGATPHLIAARSVYDSTHVVVQQVRSVAKYRQQHAQHPAAYMHSLSNSQVRARYISG